MKILFLSTDDPGDFKSGGAQRSNAIREALERIAEVDTIVIKGDDLSYVKSEWGAERMLKVATSHAANRSQRVRAIATARRLIREAVAQTDYDFIVARYFRQAALVPLGAHRKLVIDGDDLRQSPIGKPVAKRLGLRVRATGIRFIARRAFHVWLVDPRDRGMLDAGRTRHSILANTAKPPNHATAIASKSGRRLLMVGYYPYPPNEEGLVWFARNILPELAAEFPDIQLHAIGRYYQPALNALGDHVRMRGFVDDLDAEYAQADIVVCPVLSGTGTQIKVVEALLHGRPTVVSAFSYKPFADVITPDEHILVATEPRDWVRQITKVLRDPAKFAAMAKQGRRVAEIAYGEESFKDRVISTFRGKS